MLGLLLDNGLVRLVTKLVENVAWWNGGELSSFRYLWCDVDHEVVCLVVFHLVFVLPLLQLLIQRLLAPFASSNTTKKSQWCKTQVCGRGMQPAAGCCCKLLLL
mmetsp:Transcript_95213/g.218059  ORF Transcript_95213/g.218059 Transcript_95213/m.218059 type:complete len:104 (-) Transcript_95213:75-386(-)